MPQFMIYLDMDGVLADFYKEYIKIDPEKSDRKKFRDAVMVDHIFEKLDFLPDTQKLLDYVSTLENTKIEILTSMGTFNYTQGTEAKRQKLNWLQAKNITYHANFVNCKEEKAQYACKHCILIDDSVGCIDPFVKKGGIGILHTSADRTIEELNEIYTVMRLYA